MVRGIGSQPSVNNNTLATVESVGEFTKLVLIIMDLQNPNLDYRIDLRKEILSCRESGGKKIDLYTLLVHNSMARSTEPEDKIFSLMNLATDCTLAVDYSVGMPNVCIRVAKYLVDKLGSLEPLRFGEAERSDPEGRFPSWCPDWSRTHENWERRLFERFSCTSFTRPEYSVNCNVLIARGLVLRKVHFCSYIDGGPIGNYKSNDKILVECVQHGLCPSDYYDRTYPAGGTYENALLEVRYLENRPTQVNEDDCTVNSIHEAGTGRLILFQTCDGYIRRAFDRVSEGDLVCALLGSKALVIMKREGDHWKYISQAYGKAERP